MTDLVDVSIRRFASFLRESWQTMDQATRAPRSLSAAELRADWLQANWEILVEAVLRDALAMELFLEPYGEGAECNGDSSRVWLPSSPTTHRVICVAAGAYEVLDMLRGDGIDIDRDGDLVVFDHFGTRCADGWHEEREPFDCVIGYYRGIEVLLPASHIKFELRALSVA